MGWLVELLEELELEPHLVHPSRCRTIASARLNNDKVDAATLAQLGVRLPLLSLAAQGVARPLRAWRGPLPGAHDQHRLDMVDQGAGVRLVHHCDPLSGHLDATRGR
jgi:hypothetical protein